MAVARNRKWFNFGLCDAKQRSTPDICVNVELIARKQDIITFKISERNTVGLLAVTNMATGRNVYIYLFEQRVLRTIFGSGWVDKIVYRGT